MFFYCSLLFSAVLCFFLVVVVSVSVAGDDVGAGFGPRRAGRAGRTSRRSLGTGGSLPTFCWSCSLSSLFRCVGCARRPCCLLLQAAIALSLISLPDEQYSCVVPSLSVSFPLSPSEISKNGCSRLPWHGSFWNLLLLLSALTAHALKSSPAYTENCLLQPTYIYIHHIFGPVVARHASGDRPRRGGGGLLVLRLR